MMKLEFEMMTEKIPYYDNTTKAKYHIRIKNYDVWMVRKEVAIFKNNKLKAIIEIINDKNFKMIKEYSITKTPKPTSIPFRELKTEIYDCYLIDSREDIETLKVGLSL